MRDERGSWYLLTGFVIGMISGLVYAWAISPVQYLDASPGMLRSEDKDRYRALIAVAYMANADLLRARARLNLLGDDDVAAVLARQAQDSLAGDGDPREAQALGLLAVAIGQEQGLELTSLQANAEQIPATIDLPAQPDLESPGANLTPLNNTSNPPGSDSSSSITAPPILSLETPAIIKPEETDDSDTVFVLQDSTFLCNSGLNEPVTQALAVDSSGKQLPGVEVIVIWDGGEERFFTGLKPELGPGYADFVMAPGRVYNLQVSGGQIVAGITSAECDSPGGDQFWGSWLVVFSQTQ